MQALYFSWETIAKIKYQLINTKSAAYSSHRNHTGRLYFCNWLADGHDGIIWLAKGRSAFTKLTGKSIGSRPLPRLTHKWEGKSKIALDAVNIGGKLVTIYSSGQMYIYIYIYMCVCVCVCKRFIITLTNFEVWYLTPKHKGKIYMKIFLQIWPVP